MATRRLTAILLLGLLIIGCGDGGRGGEAGSDDPDKPPNPVDYNLSKLSDDDLDDRWAAIRRLPRLEPDDRPRAMASLRRLVESDSAHVRRAAAVALTKMDPSADDLMPILVEALEDRDHRVRAAAMETIVSFGPERPDVRAVITDVVANDEVKVRLVAVDTLIAIQPRTPDVTETLAAYLDDSFLMVRRKALDALLAVGVDDPDTFAALLKAVGNEHRHVRLPAMEALIAADPEIDGVVDALTEYLTHEDAKLAGLARDRLLEMDPETPGVVAGWGRALEVSERDVRREIVDQICQAGTHPDLVELLGQAIWDADHLTFAKAMRRLEELGPDARPAAPALLELLDGRRYRGYITALEVLIPLADADPTLVEPICDALLTDGGQVRGKLLEELMHYARGLETLSRQLAGLVLRPDVDEAKKRSTLDLLTTLEGWALPAGPILRDGLEGDLSPTVRSAVRAFLSHLAETPPPTRIARQEEH